MTERVRRRVVSLWLPELPTTQLWRGPVQAPAASPDDAALLSAIRQSETLAHWCGRYTPWTALDDDGGIWLDITGCAHLFGGERALLADLTARIADQGLAVRCAAADTPGAAWAVARFAAAGPERSFAIVESGAQREMLSPLSAAALRLGARAAEALRRVGVRRIGDLYPMPRAPLAARFGADVLRRLDQALGGLDEPLSPIRPLPPSRVRLGFPDPIGRRSDLWAAFERLLDALLARLAEAGDGARRLELIGYRSDGTLTRLEIGLGRASRERAHIHRLMAEKFDAFDPGYGIEAMVLAALSSERLAPVQPELNGTDRAEADLARLIDRLGNRLGGDRLGGLACAPSHVPERAARPVPSGDLGTVRTPTGPETPSRPRPLHLLSPPEPIEAMAPVPDGPPVLFKWRRTTHRVARAEGPERIAPEWWLEDPARLASGQARLRDYYHVEDEGGARYWLFRAGLYSTDKPPRWYLHGLFS